VLAMAINVPPEPTITWPNDTVPSFYGREKIFSLYIRNSSGNELDYTPFIIGFDIVKELNRLEFGKFKLQGLENSDLTDYIKKGSTIKFFSERKFYLKLVITSVERSGDYIVEVTALGCGQNLMDDANYNEFNFIYNDEDSDTIVADIIGSSMSVDKNENLGTLTGAFTFENKMTALASIANYFQSDWWVSQTHPYNTNYFNISHRRGRIPVIKKFYDDGINHNVSIIRRLVDQNKFATDIIMIGADDREVEFIESHESLDDNIDTPISMTGLIGTNSKTLMVKVSVEQTPVYCYVQVSDDSGNTNYKVKEINIVGGRDVIEFVDISKLYINGKWLKANAANLTMNYNATTDGYWKMYLGQMGPATTRFSAVNNVYSKLETDINPVEMTAFNMALEDCVAFPTKGIVAIGDDYIGYLSNEGNVLWNCMPDIWAGSQKHRAGVLVFPIYDATGKANTFITTAADSNKNSSGKRVGNTFFVQDTSNFSASGKIIIGGEVCSYTSKTSTTFVGCSTTTDGINAQPHSKYTRIFQYDSTKHYKPGSGTATSLDETHGQITLKIVDKSIYDNATLEMYASKLLELSLDENAAEAGGLVTVQILSAVPLKDAQDIDIGDTIYVNSTKDNFEGNFEVIGMRWSFDPTYGENLIIEAGNRTYKFVEDMLAKATKSGIV